MSTPTQEEKITIKIGFSGTSKGMMPEQKIQVRTYLTAIRTNFPDTILEFHHGLCIGADHEAAIIAKELGFRIVAHPGFNPRNPKNRLYRADFDGNDETREEKPFIKRDQNIVNETSQLIAAPLTRDEQIRSGTWTTVRYALKQCKSMLYALPDPATL